MPDHFWKRDRRPPWWPENEPWPPARSRMRHNPFFRRMGCVFVVFNLAGMVVFFLVATWITNILGLTQLPENFLPWLIPLRIGILLLVIGAVVMAFYGLRRVFMPLDDLLDASKKVAEGDYSARVPERGLPEVRSLARAFNNMATRLSESDEKRRNMMADVTHELRTPLTVIHGNLEGMLDGVYAADEANLRALLDETDLLARLVDDLRTLALAESGALQLRREVCDLVLLARETFLTFQPQASRAGITLDFEGEEDMPWVSLDAVRMRQVIFNLVANALRYSPAGSTVRMRVRVENDQYVMELQDEGPGIPSADLPHVFERFYKSADSGGMGLGLAIARHLVNAHGGQIEARSAPGEGTSMRISLPVDAQS